MIIIKNWSSFQSYKDRRPPWVRLHKSLLDNFDFQNMSADARAILPMLWLIASEDDNPKSGLIKLCIKKIAFRLRNSYETVTNALREIESSGFIEISQDDISLEKESSEQQVTDSLRNSYETVQTETETETETDIGDVSVSTKRQPKAKGLRLSEDWVLPLEWGKWALEEGLNREEILKQEEVFRDYWIAKPGQQGVKSNWQATWRNWIRKSREFKK